MEEMSHSQTSYYVFISNQKHNQIVVTTEIIHHTLN